MNIPFRALTKSTTLKQFMWRELAWKLPSKDTLRRLIPPYYLALASDLRGELKGVDSLCITTDSTFLTSHQVPYICITGHWINNWKLHHTVLAVFVAEQGENAEFIAGRMKEVLEVDLRLTDKVHCVVTDEGQNFLNAVTILKEKEVLQESLRCACHRIQLSVKKAMTHRDCGELLATENKIHAWISTYYICIFQSVMSDLQWAEKSPQVVDFGCRLATTGPVVGLNKSTTGDFGCCLVKSRPVRLWAN